MIIEEITLHLQQHTRIVGCEKTKRAIASIPEMIQAALLRHRPAWVLSCRR